MIQQLVKNPENGAKNSIKKQDSTAAAQQAADRQVAGISMSGVHIKNEDQLFFIQRKFMPAFGYSVGKLCKQRKTFEEGNFLKKIHQHNLHSVRFLGPDKKTLSKSVHTALKHVMREIGLVKNQTYLLATAEDIKSIANKN